MTDSPKLEATLEQLEAERRRRIDEKIERGEAIRVPALSVVVGVVLITGVPRAGRRRVC